MLRKIIKRWLRITVLIILSLEVSASHSRREAERQNSALDLPLLSADNKAQLSEALRLQRALGDQVWPGLGRAAIPIILFNDRYEFLIGKTDPPATWTVVESDNFNGEPYYRRTASNPQAFAVQVGAQWAGSMSALDRMNRKSPLKLSRDFHVVGDPAYSSYRPGLPYWQTNFVLLERQLSRRDGDLRFYLSGMAQARLLDGLSPGWKEKAMRSGERLEDMLRASVGRDAK